jgi:hypothetical protein
MRRVAFLLLALAAAAPAAAGNRVLRDVDAFLDRLVANSR